jgi:SAM-dependent MidA family methyltransferase
MPEAGGLLADLLGEIRSRGPVPFARYMDLCLYHPRFGYYTRGLGGGGGRDYVTSSGTHRAFGVLLARQAEEMWNLAGRPDPFDFVEYGPGEGHFAADFLAALPPGGGFAAALRYTLVDPSPALRARQESLLAGVRGVGWRARSEAELLDEVRRGRPLVGCLFANEVVDAFPVHRIVGTERGPREVHVGERDGALVETLLPPSTPLLAGYLEASGIALAEGQEVDLNLAASAWMERALAVLDRGYAMIVDYGYEARELFHPGRRRGTLLAYHGHRVNEEFLLRPGEQDLTAHVDFSALRRAAGRAGARVLGLTTQAKFLLALGALEMLEDCASSPPGRPAAEAARDREGLKDLFLPGRLGERFRVLVLSRGDVPGNVAGLREPWARAGASMGSASAAAAGGA